MLSIATHNGSFHADDVFAVTALQMYLRQQGKEDITIIRTRDKQAIAEADYVLDVGGEHDPAAGMFDHHQEGGAGKRENGIPYAAFGLIWKKYGEAICGGNELMADKIDSKLVQAIDAPDNGVSLTENLVFDDVYPYFLQSAVNIFKPTWREEQSKSDQAFNQLVEWATVLLRREIQVAKDQLAGGQLVEDAYEAAEDKRVIELDRSLPHQPVLTQKPEPLFVVYPKDSGIWRLRGVSEANFEARKDLPKAWRGKRGKDLKEVTGVESAEFCHSSLPMITANTKEGIDKLTKMALED